MIGLKTEKIPLVDSKAIVIKNAVLAFEKSSGIIDSLYSGLLFHAPLSQNKNAAETGQAFTGNGNLSYQEHYGISCVTGDSVAGLFCPDTNFPVVREACTMSIWICKADDFDSGIWNSPMCYGNQEEVYKNRCLMISANDGFLGAGANSAAMIGTTPLPDKRWIHCLATFAPEGTGVLVSLYLDGVLDSSNRLENIATELSTVRLMPRGMYLAGARIYNRVLSEDEIQQLAEEYVPFYPPKGPWNLTSNTSDPSWELFCQDDQMTIMDGSEMFHAFDGDDTTCWHVQQTLPGINYSMLKFSRTDGETCSASKITYSGYMNNVRIYGLTDGGGIIQLAGNADNINDNSEDGTHAVEFETGEFIGFNIQSLSGGGIHEIKLYKLEVE